jgi:hypothetical protein
MVISSEERNQGEEDRGENVIQPWRSCPMITLASPTHESRLNHRNGKGIRETTEPAESQTMA